MILGYFTKLVSRGNRSLDSQLQAAAKKLFSDKYLTLEGEVVIAFADILNLISTNQLGLAIEILFDLLPSAAIDPKRQIVALSAYTAIGNMFFSGEIWRLMCGFVANRLGIHQEETVSNIKITSKKKRTTKFATSRKLLKTFRQTSLSIRSRSTLIGNAEEAEVLRVTRIKFNHIWRIYWNCWNVASCQRGHGIRDVLSSNERDVGAFVVDVGQGSGGHADSKSCQT